MKSKGQKVKKYHGPGVKKFKKVSGPVTCAKEIIVPPNPTILFGSDFKKVKRSLKLKCQKVKSIHGILGLPKNQRTERNTCIRRQCNTI